MRNTIPIQRYLYAVVRFEELDLFFTVLTSIDGLSIGKG